MEKKKRAGLESLCMNGLKNTTAAIKDPTELFLKIVEYILDRAPGEYATADELMKDISAKFDNVLGIMKQNFERWKKEEAPNILKTMGIELMDSKNKADFEISDTDFAKPGKDNNNNEEEDEEDKDEGPTLDENFFEDDNETPERNPRAEKPQPDVKPRR